MNAVEKRMIRSRELMQEQLPLDEQIQGIVVAMYRKPGWMYFIPYEIMLYEFRDYDRVFDIGFSEKTIIIIGYKRLTVNYTPKKIWTLPMSEAKLERGWILDHLYLRDEGGKQVSFSIYNTGVNKKSLPSLKKVFENKRFI